MTERIIDAIISSTPVLGLIGVTGVFFLIFRRPIIAWIKVKATNEQYEHMHGESMEARDGVRSQLSKMDERMETIGTDMAIFRELHGRNDKAHEVIFGEQRNLNGRLGRVEGHVKALREK